MSILDPSVPRTGLSRRATVAVAAAALVVLAPLAAIQPWAGVEARAEAPSLDATTPFDDRAVPQARPAPRAAARRIVEQRRTDAGLLDDAIGDAIQDVLREIPTIVVSAAGRDRMGQVSADAYLSKPVDMDELLARVSQFCTTV